MTWITLEKVRVDCVACPWLIQKFIDPQAEFSVDDALSAECRRHTHNSTKVPL
jgi:hypothetical protein